MSDKNQKTVIEALASQLAHCKANCKHLGRIKHKQKLYIDHLRKELGNVHSMCHPENPVPDTEEIWARTGRVLQENMEDQVNQTNK